MSEENMIFDIGDDRLDVYTKHELRSIVMKNEERYLSKLTDQDAKSLRLICRHDYLSFSMSVEIEYESLSHPEIKFVDEIKLPLSLGRETESIFKMTASDTQMPLERGTWCLRAETADAREEWLRKNIFKGVWGKTGKEAIEAFKIEYSALIGTTLWSGLSTDTLYNACRAYRARMEKWKPERIVHPLLLAGWDAVFSHAFSDGASRIQSIEEIHNYFPRSLFPDLTEGTIDKFIQRYKLPRSPGAIKAVISPSEFISQALPALKTLPKKDNSCT